MSLNKAQQILSVDKIWFNLLKGGAPRKFRDILADTVVHMLNEYSPLNNLELDNYSEHTINQLKSQGYCFIDFILSSKEVMAIRSSFANLPTKVMNGQNGVYADHDLPITEDSPSPPFTHAFFSTEHILSLPVIANLINNKQMISVVQSYLGCTPTLSTASCWWSFPRSKPVGPQYFHQDRGDFKSLNLFIYITDVDSESGPHIYCPCTHTYELLCKHVNKNLTLAERIDFWKWWETHRKTDIDVTRFFSPLVLTGPAGTAFFEDTRGLHKGMVPISKKRLVFELVWTVIPQFNSNLKPVKLPPSVRIGKISETVKFCNRLAYLY